MKNLFRRRQPARPPVTPVPEGDSTARETLQNLFRELHAVLPRPAEPAVVVEDQSPVIRFVNAVLVQSMEDQAADIFLEPTRKNIIVRCRIDGVLQETMSLPGFA